VNWDQLGSAAASMGIALLIFAAAVAVTGVFLAGWRPWRRERKRAGAVLASLPDEDPETGDREGGGECLGQASRRGRFSVSPAASRMRFT
jgi:hypothetical protein